jgi:hypothetical protein
MIGNYVYEYFAEQGKLNSHMDYPTHLYLSVQIQFHDDVALLRQFSYLTLRSVCASVCMAFTSKWPAHDLLCVDKSHPHFAHNFLHVLTCEIKHTGLYRAWITDFRHEAIKFTSVHVYVHIAVDCSKCHDWNICNFLMLLMQKLVVHRPLYLTLKYPGFICETAVESWTVYILF